MTAHAAMTTSGKSLQVATATSMTGMQSMASKMWAPWLAMGFMIVVASLIIGLINASTTADYYAFSKAEREAAVAGSTLVGNRVFMETTAIWLPAFKFLGRGMLLGGITFALATILGNLRAGGGKVQGAIGKGIVVMNPPMTAQLFPMIMMMGVMLLVAALIVSIWLATVAAGYGDHSIATELNPAASGSELLSDLGTISAVKAWLAPLKFVGLAMLLSGITLALATFIQVLRFQTTRIIDLLK